MECRYYEGYGVGLFLFADVERVVLLAVDQREAFADILQPDARIVLPPARRGRVAAVGQGAGHLSVGIFDPQVDERRAVVADAVLEGVFDEDDQQQRRAGCRDIPRGFARRRCSGCASARCSSSGT